MKISILFGVLKKVKICKNGNVWTNKLLKMNKFCSSLRELHWLFEDWMWSIDYYKSQSLSLKATSELQYVKYQSYVLVKRLMHHNPKRGNTLDLPPFLWVWDFPQTPFPPSTLSLTPMHPISPMSSLPPPHPI